MSIASHVARAALLVLLAASASPVANAGATTFRVTDQAGRPLPNAVVYLEASGPRPAAPAKPAMIQQIDKQFMPMVTVVQTGSAVSFPNNDTVRHQVYSFSPAKVFELRLYAGVPQNPIVFDKAGTVVLGCNIHDRMVAYLQVVDTPYFAKTDAGGEATIDGVAPGSYRLRSWHYAQAEASADQVVAIKAEASAFALRLSIKDQASNGVVLPVGPVAQ